MSTEYNKIIVRRFFEDLVDKGNWRLLTTFTADYVVQVWNRPSLIRKQVFERVIVNHD